MADSLLYCPLEPTAISSPRPLRKRRFVTDRQGRRSRGVTLIEVLIVVSILGLISAGIAVAVLPLSDDARRKIAAQNVLQLRSAALQWRATSSKPDCPSFSQLTEARVLDRTSKKDDPWGSPYRIRCEEDEIYVSSLGKDRKESDDDIEEPPSERK